jgi:hypothetical protein
VESVIVGAFCTVVVTVFEVVACAMPLESVYVAVAVFEMTVFGAVTVADAALGTSERENANTPRSRSDLSVIVRLCIHAKLIISL